MFLHGFQQLVDKLAFALFQHPSGFIPSFLVFHIWEKREGARPSSNERVFEKLFLSGVILHYPMGFFGSLGGRGWFVRGATSLYVLLVHTIRVLLCRVGLAQLSTRDCADDWWASGQQLKWLYAVRVVGRKWLPCETITIGTFGSWSVDHLVIVLL
jgi:hypothetical protein